MSIGPNDNRPWDYKKIRLHTEGQYNETFHIDAKQYTVEYDSNGIHGQRLQAYDTGKPELILDAIQHDNAVSKIQDLPIRAAMILRSHGLAPEAIGSIIRDKKKRPARTLINEGIRQVRECERLRYEAYREDS